MKIEENAFINNSLGINSRCKLLANLESIEDLNNIEFILHDFEETIYVPNHVHVWNHTTS